MIDVLLIRPHRPQHASMSPLTLGDRRQPLGLGFLQAYLQKHGYNVEILDNDVQPAPLGTVEWTAQYAMAKKPEYIGVYVQSAGLVQALELLDTLHRQTDSKLVVGGPHYTLFTEEIPDFVDHVIVGEGEKAFLDIVSGNVTSRIHKRELIAELDELPWPSYDYFMNQNYDFSVDIFGMKPKVVSINSSRGCPYACSFCGVQSIWGRNYRFFSARYVYDYIKQLRARFNIRGVYFREDNFVCNGKRVETFCRYLLDDGFKLEWACEARVDSLYNNPELLPLMASAGCRGLYLGVESGSQRVLDLMNKQITVEQIENVFHSCRSLGIKTYASMCYGIPGEEQADRDETQQFLKRIQPDAVSEAVFIGIPRSPLYEWIRKNKLYYHEDERHFLYPKGYRELCARYYGENNDGRFIP